jgi:hypothetical protein
MRITGQRLDGAVYLSMGGGLAVILKGAFVSPTLDETVVETMGPWTPADNSFDARRETTRKLDLARVRAVDHFALAKKSDKGEAEVVLPAPEDVALIPDEPPDGDEDDEEDEDAEEEKDLYSPGVPSNYGIPKKPKKPRKPRQKKAGGAGMTTAQRPSLPAADRPTALDPSQAVRPGVYNEASPPVDTAITLRVPRFETYRQLLLSMANHPIMKLADDAKDEHPFQWCIDHVIPAMEAEGKAPDDPNAFCAFWKSERADKG